MKTVKLFLMFASVALLSIGCSKDDDGGSGKSGFEGVPSGKIVPVEIRNETLTGFDEVMGEAKGTNESQKWWKYDIGEFISKDCPEYEETRTPDRYYAFYPDGGLYAREGVNEQPYRTQSWEWVSSSKDGIYLNGNTTTVFTITELNDGGVVYASKQNVGDCTVTTYERLHDPYTE